jgi:phospholipid/cholesterol/gamma-HCH transport system substrate-binding protein
MRRREEGTIAWLRRHELGFGTVLATLIVAITALAVVSTNGLPLVPARALHATLPAGAPALRAGDEVRVAGRRVGLVKDVGRTADGRQRVRFTTGGAGAGRDARLTVRLRSPAGGWYLALERGDTGGGRLPDGASIDPANVTYAEDLPAVVDGLGHAALRNLAGSLRLTGAGVAGRGESLNRSLDRIDGTLRGTTGLLRAATPGDALPALVRGTGRTAAALTGTAPDDAGRALTAAASVAGVLADPRSRLDATLRRLRPAEDALADVLPAADVALAQLTRSTRRLLPGLHALRAALPGTTRLLTEGPRLRREVHALATAAVPALRALQPALRTLGPAAVLLDRTLPPLGELTGYLSRYPREFEAGSIGYYIAYLYRPLVGKAPGYPIAPAMTVLTCASGTNARLEPGDAFTDRLDRPCR